MVTEPETGVYNPNRAVGPAIITFQIARRARPERYPQATAHGRRQHRCQGEPELKKLFASVLLALLLASFAPAQDKTYDVPGQFSFQYSDGWKKAHRAGGTEGELDWLQSTADPLAYFHPVLANGNFSYDDWVRRIMNQATPDSQLASKSEFATAAGVKGEKLVWNIKTKDGKKQVWYYYMFSGKANSQLMLNARVDADSATKFEPVFDGFAKSLVIEKGK
jgi:hypothetical protein